MNENRAKMAPACRSSRQRPQIRRPIRARLSFGPTGSYAALTPGAPSMRSALLALVAVSVAGSATAQEVALSEPFKPGHTTKVEVRVKVTGKLAVPSTEK